MARRVSVLANFVLAIFLGSAAEASAAPDDTVSLTACDADIHRLCESVYPDERLVASCLVRRRSELSRACAELLAHPPPEEADDD